MGAAKPHRSRVEAFDDATNQALHDWQKALVALVELRRQEPASRLAPAKGENHLKKLGRAMREARDARFALEQLLTVDA